MAQEPLGSRRPEKGWPIIPNDSFPRYNSRDMTCCKRSFITEAPSNYVVLRHSSYLCINLIAQWRVDRDMEAGYGTYRIIMLA